MNTALAGVSKLLASLGHTGRRRVVLSHTLNTQTLMKTDEQKKVLSKFTILCWAAFIAILGHIWPEGCGLDTSAREPFSGRISVGFRVRQTLVQSLALPVMSCVISDKLFDFSGFVFSSMKWTK